MRTSFVLAASLLALATGAAHAADAPPAGGYSNIYVFGDSLVDAGNVYKLSGGTTPAVANGYVDGRFTNGYDFTDLLAQQITGHVAVASSNGGTNYAYGNARVVDNGDAFPDLDAQLASYTAASGGHADANALYTLTFGGNDLFALQANEFPNPQQYAQTLVQTYVTGVAKLEQLGAKHILVTGLPASDAASAQIEIAFEAALAALPRAPGATITAFSLQNFLYAATHDPASVGLPPLSTTSNCRAEVPNGPGMDCTGYFYFDSVHPTAQVQFAAYRQVAPLVGLAAVPEPATWAELIAGFGVTGLVARRRRTIAAA